MVPSFGADLGPGRVRAAKAALGAVPIGLRPTSATLPRGTNPPLLKLRIGRLNGAATVILGQHPAFRGLNQHDDRNKDAGAAFKARRARALRPADERLRHAIEVGTTFGGAVLQRTNLQAEE